MTIPLPADAATQQLAIVVRELAQLIDRITDAALAARGLAEATDWRAKAATAFHDRAVTWAGDVSGLGCLAETLRYDADRAQDRAAWAARLAALTPGGVR